ncbi:MAG: glycosyltransferase family 2 protein [Alphaproteobacteria bacterium]|nr:glycosyltransferase family 2 protein [Alphaproteobacteria bacterium]
MTRSEPYRATWRVPEHETLSLSPRRCAYALVIPVINEGARIQRQLNEIMAANLAVDVVIADGGSSDGSVDAEFLAQAGVRCRLTKTGPGRLSAQLRMAYAWCLDEGYLGVITMDGNGKDNVEAVSQFVARLEAGYDYVQGSRYRPGGLAENTPLDRTVGNRFVHAPILSLAAGRWFTDTTNGFRAYSRDYLLDPRLAAFRDVFSNYELLFYLTVRASRLGYRVCELPVRRSYPVGEATPTKIGGLAGKLALLSQTVDAAMGRYNPPKAE